MPYVYDIVPCAAISILSLRNHVVHKMNDVTGFCAHKNLETQVAVYLRSVCGIKVKVCL
jgi:hypothetical protein